MALEDYSFDTNEHKDPEFEDHEQEDQNHEDRNQIDSTIKSSKNTKLRKKSTSHQIQKQQNIKMWRETFCKNVSQFLASCLMSQVLIITTF